MTMKIDEPSPDQMTARNLVMILEMNSSNLENPEENPSADQFDKGYWFGYITATRTAIRLIAKAYGVDGSFETNVEDTDA